MTQLLSIVIVNYNTEDLISNCLKTIKQQYDRSIEVHVVDNNSRDKSVEVIEKNFPWVNLIKNHENRGFARANNSAIAQCKGKYIFFLNPDTGVKPGALKTIVQYMEEHPEVGLAGTRLIFPDNTPQSSVETTYPGQRYARSDLKGLKGDIAWVLGASMIARASLIKEINGFDERYFLYGEDIDICLSIRKKGWEIGFICDAVIVHWEGQSEKGSPPLEVFKKKLLASQLFYNKHYSKQNVTKIKLLNALQALWRIFTLNLTIPFTRNKKEQQRKLSQYRMTLKTLFPTHNPLNPTGP